MKRVISHTSVTAVASNAIAFEQVPASVKAEGNQEQKISAEQVRKILGFNPMATVRKAPSGPRFTKVKRLTKADTIALVTIPSEELHEDDRKLQRKVMFRLEPDDLAKLSPVLAAERKRLEKEEYGRHLNRCQLDNQFCQGDRHEGAALRDISPVFSRKLGFA